MINVETIFKILTSDGFVIFLLVIIAVLVSRRLYSDGGTVSELESGIEKSQNTFKVIQEQNGELREISCEMSDSDRKLDCTAERIAENQSGTEKLLDGIDAGIKSAAEASLAAGSEIKSAECELDRAEQTVDRIEKILSEVKKI